MGIVTTFENVFNFCFHFEVASSVWTTASSVAFCCSCKDRGSHTSLNLDLLRVQAPCHFQLNTNEHFFHEPYCQWVLVANPAPKYSWITATFEERTLAEIRFDRAQPRTTHHTTHTRVFLVLHPPPACHPLRAKFGFWVKRGTNRRKKGNQGGKREKESFSSRILKLTIFNLKFIINKTIFCL